MLGTNDKYVDVVVGKSVYVWWWRRVGAFFILSIFVQGDTSGW